MSRFTVLGGRGHIGQKLVAFLRAQGHEVRVPARGDPAIFEDELAHVIYAIGITADFRTRPFDTMSAHVCVLSDVLAHARFQSLLYLSSTRVYSGRDNEEVDETSALVVQPALASDLYNISKLAGESLCLHSGRQGVRVARLSNVVGADDDDSPNFLPTVTREARAGAIRLLSDPSSKKDYVHVDDVTQVLPRIALEGKHTVYNVASGRSVSHADWVRELQRLHQCTIEVAPGAPVLDFPNISIRRLRQEFGFQPVDVLQRVLV